MSFSHSYEEAQELFTDSAETAGLRVVRHRIVSPLTSELYQTYALLKRDPQRLFLHVCGVHGAEAYAGSAVQVAFLQKKPFTNASGPSVLFVHPINPYGMAFTRRTNAQNVDLNRNYIQSPAKNADYALFDRYLNPKTLLDFPLGSLVAHFHKKRIGPNRTVQAIAGGQSTHPHGIFFTGTEIQREILLFQSFLRTHFSEIKQIVALDFHTGLGKPGEELLFADEDRNPSTPDLVKSVLQRENTQADPKAGTYTTVGRFSDSVRAALPSAHLHYLVQEMGTLPHPQVFNALRKEALAWRRRKEDQLPPHGVRQMMMEAFCPSDPAWREKIVNLGVQRIEQCLGYLGPVNQKS